MTTKTPCKTKKTPRAKPTAEATAAKLVALLESLRLGQKNCC